MTASAAAAFTTSQTPFAVTRPRRARLAVEIGDDPMLFTLLNRLERQREHPTRAVVHSQAAETPSRGRGATKGPRVLPPKQAPALFRGQPVPQSYPKAPHALDAADARRQLRTEETSVPLLHPPPAEPRRVEG